MLLLIDVGNTAVTYGIYAGGKQQDFGSTAYDEFPKLYKKWCKSGVFTHKNHIIVSSVVPQFTHILKRLLKSPDNLTFYIGENLKLPLGGKYRGGLGQDRLVNIYGAYRMYPAPFLVIDYGTAVTFDLVTRGGRFQGGLIIPGPEISFQHLLQRAAQLPKGARLPTKAKSFLGLSTYDCMSSGILQGYGAMTDGLIDRFRDRYGKKLYVIATGGFATHLKPYFSHANLIDPQHTIKSLLLIHRDMQAGTLKTK